MKGDLLAGVQVRVAEGVGDEFGGEERGRELEVEVRVESGEGLDLLPCGAGRLKRRREANQNTPLFQVLPFRGLAR